MKVGEQTGAAHLLPGQILADVSPFTLASLLLVGIFAIGAFLTAPYAFSVDDVVYIEMARAMAERGSFTLGGNSGVEGAPVLTTMFTLPVKGEAVPQYPGFYGIVAAPFYALFGVRGLVLMNALACAASLLLTFKIADRLWHDRRLAWTAMALLGVCTFLPAYGFAIWPHMLALAAILAATERALAATEHAETPRHGSLVLAGLLAGLAFNLRIDAVLGAVALFFWLRLFAAPSRRSAALAFAAGVFPALILSSLINHAKFGHFMPFYYAPAGKGANVSQYTALLGAAGLAVILAFAVDTSRAWVHRSVSFATRPRMIALLLAAALLVVALSASVRSYLYNIYVLTVDLQQVSDRQLINGIARLDNGYVSFSGLTKTALLQSVPFAVLALAGVWAFLRGRDVKENALGLMMIGAAICFFAIRQWHGGFGHNMRYLLLALPFICILSARPLLSLLGQLDARSLRLDLALGAISILLALRLAALAGPESTGFLWSVYYAPLWLAVLFASAGLWRAIGPQTRRAAHVFQITAGAVLAMSAAISFDDLTGHTNRVANYRSTVERTRLAVPEGALMVTMLEPHMLDIRRMGAFQIHPSWTPRETVAAAMQAFLKDGRCVFVQSALIRDELNPYVPLQADPRPLPGFNTDEPDGLVYEPEGQPAGCMAD